MSRAVPHLNVTVLGKPKDNIDSLTLALVDSTKAHGKVITGDYLEPKTLSSRQELFHIQYHTARFECEHIHAPLLPSNVAKMAPQTDVLILVRDANLVPEPQYRVILDLVRKLGVRQVLLFLNVSPEVKDALDSELLELAELEAQEFLSEVGFTADQVRVLSGCLDVDGARETAERMIGIIDSSFQAGNYDALSPVEVWVETVYHVSAKGLKNAPVAFSFLKSGTVLRGMDLHILGLTTEELSARVRSLEVFGEEVERCEAGRSVAILLERLRKNFPKAGQVLVTDPVALELAQKLTLSLMVASETNSNPMAALGSYQQLEVFCNMAWVMAHVVDLSPDEEDPKGERLRVHVSLDRPLAIMGNDGVVISSGNNVLATGIVASIG